MSFWGIWFASGASQAPLILFCISVRSVAIAHLPFTWRLPYTHAFSWVQPIFVSAPCLQQNFPTDTPGNTDPSIHTTQTDNYNKTRCFPHETDKTFPPTRTRWVTDESLFALDGSHLTSSTSQIRIPQKRTDSLEGPACIIGGREDNGIFWCDGIRRLLIQQLAAPVAEPCCSGHPPASAPGPGLFFKAAHQAPSLALGIALCLCHRSPSAYQTPCSKRSTVSQVTSPRAAQSHPA